MKTLLVACLLVTTANAGTINLPLPTIAQINPSIPATCTWVYTSTPHTIAEGFSADGNYVLGVANDVAICGHSGRGSNLHAYAYCASFMWDLSGNLVSTTIGVCPSNPGDQFNTYTNAAGYTAETYYVLDYGYVQYEYPVLVTP